MQGIVGEVRMNSLATFSDGLLHMDTPMWGDLQKTYVHQLCVDTGCKLEDLPWVMSNSNGEGENKRNPCCYVMMIMALYIEDRTTQLTHFFMINHRWNKKKMLL